MRARRLHGLLTSALAVALGACAPSAVAPVAPADAALDAVAAPDVATADTAVTPDAVAVDVATPDVAAPDVATPDVAAPDVATPDAVAPDAVAPDVVAPDAVAPDAVAPDVVAPDVVAPDVVAPDVIAPDALAVDGALDGGPAASCMPGQASCDPSTNVRMVCAADGSGSTPSPCPVPANASSGACTGMGVCTFSCGAGYGDCNGAASDGCEVPLATSAAHCGGCGRPCGARANAAATCAGGACVYACNAGFGDCDGEGANGCETPLGTSALHCGACGRACSAGQACGGGVCAEETCYGLCDLQPSRVHIVGTNVRAQRIEIAVSGRVTRFGLYVASGGRRARMALYTDAREGPYALVAQTAPFSLVTGRQEVSAVAPAEVIAGAYWLAVQFDTDTTINAAADHSPYPVTAQDTISFTAALSNPFRVIGRSMTSSLFNLFVLVN